MNILINLCDILNKFFLILMTPLLPFLYWFENKTRCVLAIKIYSNSFDIFIFFDHKLLKNNKITSSFSCVCVCLFLNLIFFFNKMFFIFFFATGSLKQHHHKWSLYTKQKYKKKNICWFLFNFLCFIFIYVIFF